MDNTIHENIKLNTTSQQYKDLLSILANEILLQVKPVKLRKQIVTRVFELMGVVALDIQEKTQKKIATQILQPMYEKALNSPDYIADYHISDIQELAEEYKIEVQDETK